MRLIPYVLTALAISVMLSFTVATFAIWLTLGLPWYLDAIALIYALVGGLACAALAMRLLRLVLQWLDAR